MKNKFILAFILFFAIAIFSVTTVLADEWFEYDTPDIEQMTVYVNGEEVWFGQCVPDTSVVRWNCTTEQYETPALEREEEAEVKVTFRATDDFDKTKVKAWIGGYHEDIEAETPLFDVFANNTYTKILDLYIPKDIDARDSYTLHVDIEQKHDLSGIDEADIDTTIQRMASVIEIMSVEIYDSRSSYGFFEAGTTLYIDVAVKNRGNYEAEDVYVSVSINELYLERIVYLGDLEASDDEDENDAKSITIALFIPETAYEGTYTVEVEAYNSEVSDKEFRNINIEGPGKKTTSTGGIIVTPQITSNEIEMGKGGVYTLLVANFEDYEENFVISVFGTEGGCAGSVCTGWADATINPQAFTLESGESRLVNVYLAIAENAVEGEHIFSVRVSYGSESDQFSLSANVTKGEAKELDFKTILMIAGIILAVAIIVLLIVLLTTKNSVEKTEMEESYY